MTKDNATTSSLVLAGAEAGLTIIPASTPLTRLNYFDGKFLRAADLELEQKYLRSQIALSNQGLGSGIVYGFDCALAAQGIMQIGAGLAMDRAGHALLLPQLAQVSLSDLFDKASPTTNAPNQGQLDGATFQPCEAAAQQPATATTNELWIISVGLAEALCGREDVYGKLCELACISSSERPYRLEGLVVRASPLRLTTPLPTSTNLAIEDAKYLRSRVAHAYFEDERLLNPDAIEHGLRQDVFCRGANYEAGYADVPIAVVARDGSTLRFVDAWTVRRERMQAPSQRYWQWKTMLRPWPVFSAQVLQFQCQLRDGLAAAKAPPANSQSATLLGEAAAAIAELQAFYADVSARLAEAAPAANSLDVEAQRQKLDALASKLSGAKTALDLFPAQRQLITAGLTHLPPAGFLPVHAQGLSINEQVHRLLGDGLDLRFCVARPDYIAGEFEEGQHLERISLLDGIGNLNKPRVDIFVPDGEIVEPTAGTPGIGFALDVHIPFGQAGSGELELSGAARFEPRTSGALQLYAAAGFASADVPKKKGKARAGAAAEGMASLQQLSNIAAWLDLSLKANPLDDNAPTTIGAELNAYLASPESSRIFYHLSAEGQLKDIVRSKTSATATLKATAQITDNTSKVLFRQELPPIRVELDSLTSPATLTVSWDGKDSNTASLEVDWSDYPETKLALFVGDNSDTPVGDAKAVATEEVFRPQESHHIAASSAIELVASEVDPVEYGKFGDSAPRLLLFPRDEATRTGQLLVHGNHDWVMFRRRREKHCTNDFVPVPKTSELYSVFVALDEDNARRLQIRTATLIGSVSFESDAATLVTSVSDVQAPWSSRKDLQLTEIAIASTLDDEVLQRARFNRYATAVGSFLPLPAASPLLVGTATQLPEGLPPTDTQGVIIAFLTQAQQPGGD